MKIDATHNLMLTTIAKAIDDKQGENPLFLDVQKISSIASYYVFCNGDNTRQNKAILDEIYDELAKHKIKPLHKEGMGTNWCLLDYGDMIIHVFMPDTREFYDLEGLWADAPRIDITKLSK